MSEHLDQILEQASIQKGYVATWQLPDLSSQLFAHHEQAGNLERVLHGIYRAPIIPTTEDEELVVAYLWSRERGVISHETALALYQLSDAMPAHIHITLPTGEKPVRRKTPETYRLHFDSVPDEDRRWHDVFPITSPERTLVDFAVTAADFDLFDQALDQAIERRLVGGDFERELIHRLMGRQRGNQ